MAYALTLLFAALAMASKSSTVVLPVVLCLCAWWVEGRWHWRNVVRAVPVFLMSCVASAVSIWTQRLQQAAAADPQWARTWPQRLAAAGDAVWFYLGKLLWPDPLITIYPRWQIDAGQWISYLPLLAVILLFSILWLKLRSDGAGSRACFFAFGYFMTALLPVLGLIDTFIFRYSLVFDHFQYLASMGPLALAGAALARAADYVVPRRPWLQSALCAGLLIVLGIASWQRTSVFKTHETLWSDTLAKNPDSWVGHNNLGLTLFENGQPDEAIEQFQKALELNPDYVDAHSNLGLVLVQIGQLNEAIAQYQKAAEINPNNAAVHYNLGVALSQKGQLDEAIAQYRKAFEINPDHAEAHNNLGNALLQKGQLDEANDQYKMAVKINPNYAEGHGNLGLVFFQKGQLDDAIAEFQEALRLNPNLSPVRESLAKAQAFLRQK